MSKDTSSEGPDAGFPQMPKFGMRWFQYNPAYHMAATLKASAQEKADYFDSLNSSLIMGTRGINPEADKMLDNADHVSGIRSKVAKDRHDRERKGANAVQLQNKSNALPTDLPNRPTEPDLKPEPKPKPERPRVGNLGFQIGKIIGGGSGDKYEQIAALVTEDEIANYIAAFCGNDRLAVIRRTKSSFAIIGKEAVRSELVDYVGSITAGEEAKNRVAVWFSRLTKLEDAKKAKR